MAEKKVKYAGIPTRTGIHPAPFARDIVKMNSGSAQAAAYAMSALRQTALRLLLALIFLLFAGFEAGQQVRIEVQHGRLVITPD
jgi:hypothetical protein